jgi:hypothetical protein
MAQRTEWQRQEDDARWRKVAHTLAYRCAVCGEIPSYEERQIYFVKRLCAFHADEAKRMIDA